MLKSVWITWENQRRSVELADALGVPLFKLIYSGKRFLRYPILCVKTLWTLVLEKPQRVIVQNPSVLLAFFVCIVKNILGFKVIVDRHSNFKLSSLTSSRLSDRLFHFMSKYSVRNANLTIVTNKYLKKVVGNWGGRGFVLQDKIPKLSKARYMRLMGRYNCVFICSFTSNDEPILEVLKAAKIIGDNIFVYITGNYKKDHRYIENIIPPNVCLTGYLREDEFQSLISSCDVVLALTTLEHTLLCAAYEGVSLSKPLILSNKRELTNYFYKGTIFVDNESDGLAKAIKEAIEKKEILTRDIIDLRRELTSSWDKRFSKLRLKIDRL